ncbi:MaoC family dehydratase [Paramixta manurensis]|uniref:MaoC family dehydratase n=1 Tax=Paramixta manurensis TaxID=2740817 RepID=A0A6M8UIC2_9GAMM|nr:MaoC family dehydratase [Erwiniaceae bacterium PD-1]
MPGWSYAERYFEDYQLGEREPERRRTLDQADISQFAGLTLDFHPAHIDSTYADPRYGGRLVHGMLTFSLVTGLNVEYNLLAISYGYEKVRFPNPLRAGDTLIASAEVVALTPHRKPHIGLVTKQYTGKNQHGEVVFSCQHILAVERRGAAA